jgi:hypothetical protein
MPARDFHHDTVRQALIADGWVITDDPLRLAWGSTILYIDLGAEHLIAAEQGERKIAVEIKSFAGASVMADLEQAVGQYIVYRTALSALESERSLYLAVDAATHERVFEERVGRAIVETNSINLVVFDPASRRVVRWLP